HLSPDYLASPYASVQLLIDNARLIYQHDAALDYVQVVDFGTSATDGNYYSTTKYRKAHGLDTLEVEVPRDIYYWYIVHPKITDEVPAYIDPDIVEDNNSHRNNITTAEHGYFWRDFIFNFCDLGYAKLKDMLKGERIVWNKFNLGGFTSHALDVLNRWLDGSMQFTSNDERPHQPVRIYRKHIGRCGEYSDMRVAAARAALIPAASVASYSTDHVWNEFWDEGWIHWDGAINDPYMYVNSWGKKFGSVFRWKSDGSFIPVTDRYSKSYSTLNIYALDSLENPIDGARVLLYTTGLDGTMWFDTYGCTDSEGKVTFVVGTERPYYARMSCDYGMVLRSGETVRVVSDSRHGIEYNRALTISAAKPVRNVQETAPPDFDEKSLYFELDFRAPTQVVRGRDLFDDLDRDATQFVAVQPGLINCFVVDASTYERLRAGQDCAGFNVMTQCDSGAISFEFDSESDWYVVFDNANALHTRQHITAVARLYAESDPAIAHVHALPCYPNPFNPSHGPAVIAYQLPQKATIEIIVYNILGQKVRTLGKKDHYAGTFQVDWDGKDQRGQILPAGVYFYRIQTTVGASWQKVLLVR
ncbi:T9SS type A sorting domain-containing protein, partial [candidate division KSB1 bacterium]|nr:T9SS type A sorting domain-containing protein [candidate division KSB1 bacterium]